MGKLKNYISGVLGAGTAILIPAMARADGFVITPPTFNYETLGTYAGTILTALAAVWLIRKFIKITNRS